MATSERTMQQVRQILGKLDRSISEARQRRLGEPDTPEAPDAAPSNESADERPTAQRDSQASSKANGSTIGVNTGPRAGSSGFGRARPISKPNSLGRWNS